MLGMRLKLLVSWVYPPILDRNSERIPRSLLERSGNPVSAGLRGASMVDFPKNFFSLRDQQQNFMWQSYVKYAASAIVITFGIIPLALKIDRIVAYSFRQN